MRASEWFEHNDKLPVLHDVIEEEDDDEDDDDYQYRNYLAHLEDENEKLKKAKKEKENRIFIYMPIVFFAMALGPYALIFVFSYIAADFMSS